MTDPDFTLPLTQNDLDMWKTELDELLPRLEQLRQRGLLLQRRIKAAEYLKANMPASDEIGE